MEIRIQAESVVPQLVPTKTTTPANASTSATAANEIKVPKSNIQVDTEEMKKNLALAINQLNEMMRDGGRNLTFQIDPSRKGQPVVVVRKEDTGEVIRQIPNPEVLKVAHSIDALKGLLMNKQI